MENCYDYAARLSTIYAGSKCGGPAAEGAGTNFGHLLYILGIGNFLYQAGHFYLFARRNGLVGNGIRRR